MIIVGLMATLAVLVLAASATSLCLFYFETYRHRAAMWMAFTLASSVCFVFALLCAQIGEFAVEGEVSRELRIARLLLTSLGSVALVLTLPRFLLAAFGSRPRRGVPILLDVATAVLAALCIAHIVTGWSDESAVPPAIEVVLRVFVYSFLILSFALVVLFRSRLPDRGLYKTVLTQLGTLLFLIPIVILEDLRMIAVPGFPSVAGLALLAAVSIIAILHARRNFARPKYVEGRALSEYFVERFRISEREREVAGALLEGLGNAQIAERLFISVRTVENHLHNIYQKTGMKNRLQLYNLFRVDSM